MIFKYSFFFLEKDLRFLMCVFIYYFFSLFPPLSKTYVFFFCVDAFLKLFENYIIILDFIRIKIYNVRILNSPILSPFL